MNRKREFSDTNFEIGKPCQHFDWNLQGESEAFSQNVGKVFRSQSWYQRSIQSKRRQGFPTSKLVSENSLFQSTHKPLHSYPTPRWHIWVAQSRRGWRQAGGWWQPSSRGMVHSSQTGWTGTDSAGLKCKLASFPGPSHSHAVIGTSKSHGISFLISSQYIFPS